MTIEQKCDDFCNLLFEKGRQSADELLLVNVFHCDAWHLWLKYIIDKKKKPFISLTHAIIHHHLRSQLHADVISNISGSLMQIMVENYSVCPPSNSK